MKKLLFLCTLLCSVFAHAVTIQEVKTASGLTAWLVADTTHPVLRFEFAFRAGSAFDPPKQRGLAALTATLLGEGAGDLDAQALRAALADIGARYSTGADQLYLTANLTTLTEHAAPALQLVANSFMAPQLSPANLARVQQQHLQALDRRQENPTTVAADIFRQALFGVHAYAHPVLGNSKDVRRLKIKDVQHFAAHNLTAANLTISVVGDISPADLSRLLDATFANLPKGEHRNPNPPAPAPVMASSITEPRAINQTSIVLGHGGVNRTDVDYYAAVVLNHILGGGGFSARLMNSVREQRGLAYSISSGFEPLPHGGAWTVGLQTKNASAAEAVALVKGEIARIRTEPVSATELQDAKDFLVNSFPLRLDTSPAILAHLTLMQQEELGIDYLTNWPKLVAAITADQVQAAAQRILKPDQLIVVQVGGGA